MKASNEKVLLILRLVLSATAMVFALIQILGLWDRANSIAIPLLGLALLGQSLQEWRCRRGLGVVWLIASSIALYCSISSMF